MGGERERERRRLTIDSCSVLNNDGIRHDMWHQLTVKTRLIREKLGFSVQIRIKIVWFSLILDIF